MKETYWIDGYNLLFYLDEAEHLEKKRDILLKQLNELVSKANIDAIVVFDGSKEFTKTQFHNLEVIYTPPGQTADDYIVEDIEAKRKKGGHLFVVSNDKHLGVSARLLKAKVLKLPQFFNLLIKKANKPKGVVPPSTSSNAKVDIRDREIDRLVKIFEERLKLYEEGHLD